MKNDRKWWKYPGPWDDEPDTYEFQSSSYQCDMQRNFSGAWCGYVLIPKEHPLHGLDCSAPLPKEFSQLWEKTKNESFDLEKDTGVFELLCADADNPTISLFIKAHGGLTYSGKHKDGRWIFGFDCSHAWDISPDREVHWITPDQVYRDFEYTKSHCERLATQMKAFV